MYLRNISLIASVTVCTAVLASSAFAAKTHREVFESLFGEKLQRIRETDSLADDAQFANELSEYTDGLEDSPQFAFYMYSQIYDMGRLHRVGFLSALEAIEQALAAAWPDLRIKIAAGDYPNPITIEATIAVITPIASVRRTERGLSSL